MLYIAKTRDELGDRAAALIARKLRTAIAAKGEARLVLSTGASQFETIQALVHEDVDWSRVTMFHLDEYVGLPETHIASFRKYLKERFVSKVNLKEAVFVNGDIEPAAAIAELTRRIREKPVDVGAIGIGENAHIAFNDPPANFDTRVAYHVVRLDSRCKLQQVGEGWFATEDEVPDEAISMSPWQIMQCECIVSAVPGSVKADAVRKVLLAEGVDPMVPGSLLKTHPDFHLFVDADAASRCDAELLGRSQREV